MIPSNKTQRFSPPANVVFNPTIGMATSLVLYLVAIVILVSADIQPLATKQLAIVCFTLLWILPVWLYGFSVPDRFEVSPQGLRIVWLLRKRLYRPEQLAGIQLIPARDLKLPMGGWISIAAWDLVFGHVDGGLSKRFGPVEAYITMVSDVALIKIRGRRPLAIGLENAKEFVTVLRQIRRDSGRFP